MRMRNGLIKAQSTVEYAMLIALIVGAVIGMQVYLARSMHGQIQRTGDQIAGQYAYGHTDLHDHFSQDVKTVEWKLPAPYDVIKTKGSYSVSSKKAVVPLTK